MVFGVARQLSARLGDLAIHFRLRRRKSSLGTLAIPPELILIVASFLPDPSVISLALTCRDLHSLCFPKKVCLRRWEKEQLFLCLEKDVPHLYYCHFCVKLHRWNKRWGHPSLPWTDWDLPCRIELISNTIHDFFGRYIPYHHARLAMNRHLYGPAHGLPLCNLETAIRSRLSHIFETTISESIQARILDDKLYILVIRTLSHPLGDPEWLRGKLDWWRCDLCRHLTSGEGYLNIGPVQLPELAKDKTAPNYFAPCQQWFRSCSFCPTDYCIDITWAGRKEGYIMKISTYRQLGDCRSPFDWAWSSMTASRRFGEIGEPRRASRLETPPGIIRKRWDEADGIYGKAQGEWVDFPERLIRYLTGTEYSKESGSI